MMSAASMGGGQMDSSKINQLFEKISKCWQNNNLTNHFLCPYRSIRQLGDWREVNQEHCIETSVEADWPTATSLEPCTTDQLSTKLDQSQVAWGDTRLSPKLLECLRLHYSGQCKSRKCLILTLTTWIIGRQSNPPRAGRTAILQWVPQEYGRSTVERSPASNHDGIGERVRQCYAYDPNDRYDFWSGIFPAKDRTIVGEPLRNIDADDCSDIVVAADDTAINVWLRRSDFCLG